MRQSVGSWDEGQELGREVWEVMELGNGQQVGKTEAWD